jgi:hypothetical protein
VLEPGHRDPVHAHVAVHPDIPGQRLAVPLPDQRGDLVAVAQYVGARDIELRVRGGIGGGLFGHPVRQHAREQEVPGHHDPPGAQQAAPLQALGHVRPGQRDEGGLGQRVVPPLPQQPGGLDHVRVGVGVGGAAADQEDGRLVGASGGNARCEQIDQRGVRPQGASIGKAGAWVTGALAGQSRWDVALGVAGRGEHERDRDYRPWGAGG